MIKTQIDRKTDKRMVLGTVLEGKNRFFVILRAQAGPLERLWEGFWKEKLETKKSRKKQGGGDGLKGDLGGIREGW